MTPLSIQITSDQLIKMIDNMGLDWGDEDDAHDLVALLLERYTPTEAWTWMCWPCVDLDLFSPITRLRDGRSRDVFAAARALSRRN